MVGVTVGNVFIAGEDEVLLADFSNNDALNGSFADSVLEWDAEDIFFLGETAGESIVKYVLKYLNRPGFI